VPKFYAEDNFIQLSFKQSKKMLKTLSKGKNIKIEKTIDANMYDSLSLFQYPYLNNNIPEANTLLL